MVVFAVVDASLSPPSPLGDAIDTFVRREDADQVIANVRRDDPQLASNLASWSENSKPVGEARPA